MIIYFIPKLDGTHNKNIAFVLEVMEKVIPNRTIGDFTSTLNNYYKGGEKIWLLYQQIKELFQ